MKGTLAAIAALLLAASAARAQEAAGDWHGTLTTPAGSLRMVLRLKPGPAGLTGEVLSPDQSAQAIPVADVSAKDGALAFAVPAVHGRFEGKWDAARKAWIGQWFQGAALPLTLEAGDLPPGPVVAGLDGEWRGSAQSDSGAQLRFVLHVRTGHYGTVGTVDVPDQLAYGLPVANLTHEGGKVSFEIPLVRGGWSGTVAPDGKTLAGAWTQAGKSRPLSLALGPAAGPRARPQTPKPPFPLRAHGRLDLRRCGADFGQIPASNHKLCSRTILPVKGIAADGYRFVTGLDPRQGRGDLSFRQMRLDRGYVDHRTAPKPGRQFLQHGLHHHGHARHDEDVADLKTRRRGDAVPDERRCVRNPRHAFAHVVEILRVLVSRRHQGHRFGMVVDADAERLRHGIRGDVVMCRPDAAGCEYIGVAGA